MLLERGWSSIIKEKSKYLTTNNLAYIMIIRKKTNESSGFHLLSKGSKEEKNRQK